MPILLLWRTANLFSLASLKMKATPLGRDLGVRRRFRMSMAELPSSILLRRPSIQNLQRQRLLRIRTPLQRRQLLAGLVGRRFSPTRRPCSTSALNLLTKQLKILSRAKYPPKPISFPHSRLLRRRDTATAFHFHHLLRPWKRNPSLVNPHRHFLPRRTQKRQKPSPKKQQLQLKQLYL